MPATTLDQAALSAGSTAIPRAYDWSFKLVEQWEKVIELNTQTVRTTLAEQQALANAALSSASFEELIELQTQRVPASMKKSFAYWQHVEEIAKQSQEEIISIMQTGWSQCLSIFGVVSDVATSTRDSGVKLLDEAGEVLTGQSSPVTSGEPVAILDSSGNVVLAGTSRGGLH
jgi:phasin family protein